ncbi:MAG TPA: NAD(P)H-dependent glycerol-3-phosphate dehydrogenase [Candidatus Magasanikbacteria bacterium]|nr:NAD(P)H-dependent glycerol-3-phosphate dehydrogenase [Candidatus Magasanikbacteria bacterium]
MSKNIEISILGTGNMGTALAKLISGNGYRVKMWGIDQEAINNINTHHENKKFLPGVPLNDHVTAHLELSETIKNTKIIIVAVPTQVTQGVSEKMATYLNKEQIILSASKGIEMNTGLTVTKIIKKHIPRFCQKNLAVLMGPLFASEISQGVPTVGVIATSKIYNFKILKEVFQNSTFFVRYSKDLIGAELAGALKNVYAIILGVCDGLGYGWNTKSAAITAAIKEMALVGTYLGGRKETFYELAGMGDLLTTGFGEKSRNRRFGEKVCSGLSVNDVLKEIGQVVEGASTVKILSRLLQKSKIKTPLLKAVNDLVNDKKDPCQIMLQILEK